MPLSSGNSVGRELWKLFLVAHLSIQPSFNGQDSAKDSWVSHPLLIKKKKKKSMREYLGEKLIFG